MRKLTQGWVCFKAPKIARSPPLARLAQDTVAETGPRSQGDTSRARVGLGTSTLTYLFWVGWKYSTLR
jgi:hypothetical protein